jgi:hypothetical protein
MSLFTGTGRDGYRFGDHFGAMLAKVETGVKTLGEKISGKAQAADTQAVQESSVLAATLTLAKEAHASGVKLRLASSTVNSITVLIEALQAASTSGSYEKFDAEGQRHAAADAVLGLRSSPSSLEGGLSSAGGCLELKSSQKRLFIHIEGGTACVGSRLVLHKDGPEARLCFRFVSEASIAATQCASPAAISRSRSPSPTPDSSHDESSPEPPASLHIASDTSQSASAGVAAGSSPDIIGRLQHVDSGLFVAPFKSTLPSDLVLIADAPSSALFAMTPAGHVLHVESAAVVCPAKARVSPGCAVQLCAPDATVMDRSVFAMCPFESYSNGHLILRSLCLLVFRKIRKYARALSSSTFVDPKCVKHLHHLSQVLLFPAYCAFCIFSRVLLH